MISYQWIIFKSYLISRYPPYTLWWLWHQIYSNFFLGGGIKTIEDENQGFTKMANCPPYECTLRVLWLGHCYASASETFLSLRYRSQIYSFDIWDKCWYRWEVSRAGNKQKLEISRWPPGFHYQWKMTILHVDHHGDYKISPLVFLLDEIVSKCKEMP